MCTSAFAGCVSQGIIKVLLFKSLGMFKQLFSFFMVAMLGFSFATHTANAQDVSGALERIDQIIAEMQSLRAELVALVSSTSVTTPTPAMITPIVFNDRPTTVSSDISFAMLPLYFVCPVRSTAWAFSCWCGREPVCRIMAPTKPAKTATETNQLLKPL